MLETFVGYCPPGKEARHLDGNYLNNHINNLKWGTRLENTMDKRRHGRIKEGEDNARSIFTNEEAEEIRRRYKPRVVTCKILAEEKGCSHWAIRSIVTGKTYKKRIGNHDH